MGLQAGDVSTHLELFRQHGYVVVPGLVDAALIDFLASYMQIRFAGRLMRSGDDMVPNTPNNYGDAGRQLAQAFLHYVDRHGPYANEKFDGRQSLMRPPVSKKSVVKDAEIGPTGGGQKP